MTIHYCTPEERRESRAAWEATGYPEIGIDVLEPPATAKSAWARFLAFTPSRRQCEAFVAWFDLSKHLLEVAALLVGLYLAIEIGSAFLPGGAVQRVLGHLLQR